LFSQRYYLQANASAQHIIHSRPTIVRSA